MLLSDRFICAGEAYADLRKHVPAPWFQKKIVCPETPEKATITVCGLGFYELFLNGKRITKGLLSPAVTNPDDVVFYDHYDITPYLTDKQCVCKFLLGNGMQNAFGGFVWDFHKAAFRSAPKLAFAIELWYADGTYQVMEADESVLTRQSKIMRDDLRLGEFYDATFTEGRWKNAIQTQSPKGKKMLSVAKPIVCRQIYTPVAIWREKNAYIYDFGINASGVCQLKIDGHRKQKIKLTFGEILKDGVFFRENISFSQALNKYVQRDTYICKEGKNLWTPKFTYHGFRYVKVEGITKKQATKDLLTYLAVNTDLGNRGAFVCDDEKLNTLHQMSLNSLVTNFHHFPTDCPHREKNGWTADAALSSSHALLYFEPTDNYKQWLTQICCAQRADGALPGIVPTAGWGFQWGNGPAWDAVLTELPWQIWQKRNDLSAFIQCKDFIVKYLAYLQTRMDSRGLLEIGLGDWCAPSHTAPLVLTDSIMAYDIGHKAALMFQELSDTENAAFCNTFANTIRDNIRTHLFDATAGTFAGNYQCSQAMGIYYGIVNPEETGKALQVLLSLIENDGYHINTGMLGGRVLFHVLAQYGKIDTAMQILKNPTAPSYMQWIDRGDTALCESFVAASWNDSRNHPAWGNVSAFFMEQICGIQPCAAVINIHPHFPTNMGTASAHFDSVYGKIATSWKRENSKLIYTLTYPLSAKTHMAFWQDPTSCIHSPDTETAVWVLQA